MASPTLYTHVQISKVLDQLGPLKPHRKDPTHGSCHMTPSARIQGATLDEERWVVHRTVAGNPDVLELEIRSASQYQFWTMFVSQLRIQLKKHGVAGSLRSPIITRRDAPPVLQMRIAPDAKIFRMVSAAEEGAPPTIPGTVAEDLRNGMPVTPIVRFDGVWCDARESGLVLHATDLLVFPDEQEFYDESGGSEEPADQPPAAFATVPDELRRHPTDADDALASEDGDWQTSVCHGRFT